MDSSRSRSVSPSPSSRSPAPNEVTTLLPPSSSRPHTPNSHHKRKASVGARSVSGRSTAGSVRGYGTVNTKPSPATQAPRRILTTLPIQLTFFTLAILTFLSVTLTLILFLNTAMDLNVPFLPYRGSGFSEFWLSLVGSWIGIGGLIFFSHPSYLFFLTSLITTILLFPILLLMLLSPPLNRAHAPLFLVPFFLTFLTLAFSLLSNFLVRRARRLESERICRMLTDVAGRERAGGDEGVARALVGMQGKGAWGRFVGFILSVLELIAGLAGVIIVTLLLIDLSISAFDGTLELPSSRSQRVEVQPSGSPWPISVHLACTDPSNSNNTDIQSRPTILYESSSGVPGSLAVLDYPPIPSADDAHLPGQWLFDMQDRGKVGRVCVWDRPGYGFSEVLGNADLGKVADALWLALDATGETKRQFALVGEGYGGLVTRVFAAAHPEHIQSLLHLDAQTAQTYFSESPQGMSVIGLFAHRISTRLLPGLLTPLSLVRFPSLLLRRSTSLSRVLASSYPKPSTTYLNENIQKARLQETFGAHSHTSASFRALLYSGKNYPSTKPAIVVSSRDRMDKVEGWEEGQRGLAEEVTSTEGLISWEKVENEGHHVCEATGRSVCEDAMTRLLAA